MGFDKNSNARRGSRGGQNPRRNYPGICIDCRGHKNSNYMKNKVQNKDQKTKVPPAWTRQR